MCVFFFLDLPWGNSERDKERNGGGLVTCKGGSAKILILRAAFVVCWRARGAAAVAPWAPGVSPGDETRQVVLALSFSTVSCLLKVDVLRCNFKLVFTSYFFCFVSFCLFVCFDTHTHIYVYFFSCLIFIPLFFKFSSADSVAEPNTSVSSLSFSSFDFYWFFSLSFYFSLLTLLSLLCFVQ